MKRMVVILIVSSIFLIGCKKDENYEVLKSIEPANNVAASSMNYNTELSKSEREQIVYQQIADRTLIDVDTLDKVSSEEESALVSHINSICNKLNGMNNDSISDEFINYLLFEMQKTPYKWEKDKVEVMGVDSATRNYIVDVTFRTNNSKYKTVIADSKIPLGCDNYDTMMQVRLNRYLDILDRKMSGFDDTWEGDLTQFEQMYGSVDEILETQLDYTLLQKAQSGEFVTYNCLVDSSEEKQNATMRVRFVLNYKYALGVSLGLHCNHMYIIDYSLEKDSTEGMQEVRIDGSETLLDAVDSLIYSENRAIDEDNYIGLYKLIDDFGKYDKYYYDMFRTSFRKIKGYAISIYEVNGTRIKAGVVRVRKIRAKGSNMSYPTYEEKWVYDIALVGDRLKIINEVLVNSTLIGEPLIVAENKNEVYEGFKSVTIKDVDKEKINEVIENFCKLQVNYDTNSKEFSNVVDVSISVNDLESLRNDMILVSDIKAKATWVKGYNSAYTGYVTLTLLEVFYKEDGTALECESEMSLVYKNNNRWQVIDYKRITASEINPNNVSTTSALSYVERDKTNVSTDSDDFNEESDKTDEENTTTKEDKNETGGTSKLPSVIDMTDKIKE